MDRQQHQGNARENRSPKKQWPAARKIDDTALWWNVAGGKKNSGRMTVLVSFWTSVS